MRKPPLLHVSCSQDPQVSQDSFLSEKPHSPQTAASPFLLLWLKKKKSEHRFLGFPGGAVLKTLHFCCRGVHSIPRSGKKGLRTSRQKNRTEVFHASSQVTKKHWYILLFSLSHPPPAHPFLLTVFLQSCWCWCSQLEEQEGTGYIQV